MHRKCFAYVSQFSEERFLKLLKSAVSKSRLGFLKAILSSIIIISAPISILAQMPGFHIHKGANKIEIPFERQDNFIIVKVLFQGLIPLKFIVDTGAEHTILIKKEISDLMRVFYEKEMTIMGTDMKTEIKAYIARKMRLDLQNLTLVKDILVLDEDYFKFDEFAGLEVHGIIGAEVFKGYVVKFDYVKQVITIYTPSVFKPSDHRHYEEIPIEILKSKPYIIAQAQIMTDTTIPLKLLLDTGGALALLLHTHSTPGLVMPDKVLKGTLGNGLGGQIEGYMGRLKTLSIGKKATFSNVISHFQALDWDLDSLKIPKRNGLIGNEILSRFNFIIDFANDKAYFQTNRQFKEKFEYDKSGLVIIANGLSLNKFIVYDVLNDSPASEADIRRGDEVISINRIPAYIYSLSIVNSKFQKKAGKSVRVVIKRDDKKIVKTIRLRNLI